MSELPKDKHKIINKIIQINNKFLIHITKNRKENRSLVAFFNAFTLLLNLC